MSLHRHARRGDLDGVRRLLAAGADVNAVGRSRFDQDGTTALHEAARSKRADATIVGALIDAGADVNATPGDVSALGLVAGPDAPAKAARLLAAGADARHVSTNGYTTLTHAVCRNAGDAATTIVRALLRAGADPDVASKYGESPLSVASRVGRFDLVRLLLDAGADAGPLGWTSLHRAAALGDDATFADELATSPDLEARDGWSRTPLAVAAMAGDARRVVALCDGGADVHAAGRCGRPMANHACAADRLDALLALLDRGADPLALDDHGHPVILDAVEHDAVGCARVLLDRGAGTSGAATMSDAAKQRQRAKLGDPRFVGDVLPPEVIESIVNDAAPWHAIVAASSVAMLALLLDAGADADEIDGEGEWPLKRAAGDGDLERARFLLDRGAAVDQTSTGETALHAAVRADDERVVRLLLDAGADPNAEDDGRTPIFGARSPEVATLLLARGATGGKAFANRIDDEETRAIVRRAARLRDG